MIDQQEANDKQFKHINGLIWYDEKLHQFYERIAGSYFPIGAPFSHFLHYLKTIEEKINKLQ